MALKFAQKSLKQDSFSGLFPVSNPKHVMKKRSPEKYIVNHSKTERYGKSAVPLQRLLNIITLRKQDAVFRGSDYIDSYFNSLIAL